MILQDQVYYLGGVPATQLVSQYGSPLYVYCADTLKRQYHRLVKAFQHYPTRFLYACKANTNLAVLRLLRQEGAWLDTVSIQEVALGLQAGFTPDQILLTPNSVSFQELAEGIETGVRINVDNLTMLERLGATYGSRVPVCIRLNPHILAGGHGHIQTGHIDSKFGISIHQLRHVLRIVAGYGLKVEGLHMHTGSDILDAGVFLQAAEVLLEAARAFPDLQYLDFGSGFKVAYRPGDPTTDVEALGHELGQRMHDFSTEYGRTLECWFEPGKFLVSEAGWLLVTANVVKQTVSTLFVGVDSGLNHLIRPMFYDAYHHVINLSNPTGPERIYSVVGYICETDTLGSDRRLNEVREGDVLAIANAGAYGMSMASNYNSRLRPAEVMVQNGSNSLVRRRETLQDLLLTQQDLLPVV